MPNTSELPPPPSGPIGRQLLSFTEITLREFARWLNAVALPEHGVQINVEEAVADFIKLLAEGPQDASGNPEGTGHR